MKLPAGTQIIMETVHDNSAGNVRNPNHPPARVKWGEQTYEEMMLGYVEYCLATPDNPRITKAN